MSKQYKFASASDANVLDDSGYNLLDLSRGFQSGTIIESIQVNSILKDHDVVANLIKDYYFGENCPSFSDDYSNWNTKFIDAANTKTNSLISSYLSSNDYINRNEINTLIDNKNYITKENLSIEDPYNLKDYISSYISNAKITCFKVGNILKYSIFFDRTLNSFTSGSTDNPLLFIDANEENKGSKIDLCKDMLGNKIVPVKFNLVTFINSSPNYSSYQSETDNFEVKTLSIPTTGAPDGIWYRTTIKIPNTGGVDHSYGYYLEMEFIKNN